MSFVIGLPTLVLVILSGLYLMGQIIPRLPWTARRGIAVLVTAVAAVAFSAPAVALVLLGFRSWEPKEARLEKASAPVLLVKGEKWARGVHRWCLSFDPNRPRFLAMVKTTGLLGASWDTVVGSLGGLLVATDGTQRFYLLNRDLSVAHGPESTRKRLAKHAGWAPARVRRIRFQAPDQLVLTSRDGDERTLALASPGNGSPRVVTQHPENVFGGSRLVGERIPYGFRGNAPRQELVRRTRSVPGAAPWEDEVNFAPTGLYFVQPELVATFPRGALILARAELDAWDDWYLALVHEREGKPIIHRRYPHQALGMSKGRLAYVFSVGNELLLVSQGRPIDAPLWDRLVDNTFLTVAVLDPVDGSIRWCRSPATPFAYLAPWLFTFLAVGWLGFAGRSLYLRFRGRKDTRFP